MKNSSHDKLLVQVRTAHRLLAAYYQRLLPTIERIATAADASFRYWMPKRFNKPGLRPFDNWQWDLLPAMNPRYVFHKVDKVSRVTCNDYVLEFVVINDSGIYEEEFRGQPDGLNLAQGIESARSVLQVGLYRAAVNIESPFFDKWERLNYPDYGKDGEVQLDKKFVLSGFEVPLQMLMDEDGIVAINNKIQNLLLLTAEHVVTHQG
ncbi:hypothetical protein ACPV5T_04630 [Vibrio astriarenae]